jgi:hypothetical protein
MRRIGCNLLLPPEREPSLARSNCARQGQLRLVRRRLRNRRSCEPGPTRTGQRLALRPSRQFRTWWRRDALRSIPFVLLALTILAPGCRTSPRHEPTATFAPPAPYVRASNSESNVLELQIAARRFVPVRGKGPTVWLTGVSHIGSSNYFAQLQRHLSAQTLVLFEGVGEHSQDFKNMKSDDAKNNAAPKAAGGMQSSLATSLGLVFQLDTIDYDRPNFRHSDLSIREIRELLAEPRGSGGGDAAEDFDNLLSMMQGDSFMNIVMQFGLGILASSPKLQAMSKVTLIEVITEMGGDPSRLGAISPELRQLLEVLIEKRNQRVIDDLKFALKEVGPKGSVSIFYGTGHMNEMENRLRKELHYQPVEDAWFSPISVNLADAGISSAELEFIRGFIRSQMKQLSGP